MYSKRTLVPIFLVSFIMLTVCGQPPAASKPPVDDTPASEIVAAQEDTQPTEAPTSPPTQSIPEVFDPTLAIIGPQEVVYEYGSSGCALRDLTDLPIRPFRDADGNVVVNRSAESNRRFIGPELDQLEAPCDVILQSSHDLDPANYNNAEWIQAVYTEDGETVYAIVHNEHNTHVGGYTGYWNITSAISTDGGATFQQSDPPDLIAAIPYKHAPAKGTVGLISGSNIIKGQDGYYYMLVLHQDFNKPEQKTCLLRSDNLADPDAWRAWDGTGFNMTFINPYEETDFDPADHDCPAVDDNLFELGGIAESLTYNTYLERYVAVSLGVNHNYGDIKWGSNYSFSEDLINWTNKKNLQEMLLSAHTGPGGPDGHAYLILLDPASESRNFETTGKQAYIYYVLVRNTSGRTNPNFDLMRFPVEFFLTEEEAEAADVRSHLILLRKAEGNDVNFTGTLTTLDGTPLANAPIEFSSTNNSDEGEIQEYTFTGVVPENSIGGVAGFRVNQECNCGDESEFFIYDFSYQEDGGSNRVANANFASGLNSWFSSGSGLVQLEASDAGSGRMLHLLASETQTGHLSSTAFSVTPGANFTFTVRARIVPGSYDSGFFGLFFLAPQNEEAMRVTIPLLPASTSIGSTITNENGEFSFTWESALPGAYLVEAHYPGDDTYWPATDITGIR